MGIAIAAVATFQVMVALALERSYDPSSLRAFLVAAPVSSRLLDHRCRRSAASADSGPFRGPRNERVVWDIPRERLETVRDAPAQDG